MTLDHYDAVTELMRQTPGVTFRSADSREATAAYLKRNPGLSFVGLEVAHLDTAGLDTATSNTLDLDSAQVIACAMCGHDGRRGYLQHVVVLPEYRNRGIATMLVERCLSNLESIGIFKTHIEVQVDNELANAYWLGRGWTKRDEIYRYSFNRSSDPNI
ncbi:MAG: N-acetyltransferase [Cyanobacteria bacterium P01_H01_bin.105]